MNGVERKNGGQEKREKTMEEGKTRKQNKRRETEDGGYKLEKQNGKNYSFKLKGLYHRAWTSSTQKW